MSSVTARSSEVKPRKSNPKRCQDCLGTGFNLSDGSVSPCEGCGGFGRVTVHQPAPAVLYVASQSSDMIDVGTCPLQDFVGRLVADWPGLRGDIVVWLVRDELCPEPRAVAVIAPGRDGKPRTTYL